MKGYELIGTEREAKLRIAEWFPKQANLYAVLDFAVCFGVYDQSHFLVGLEEQTAPVPLNWEYLRELRIFDEEKELFLVPSACGWMGRMRRDTKDGGNDEITKEYVIDEWQKLWGQAKKEEKKEIEGWTLLVSSRGTKIRIPVKLNGPGEAAIHVRRYMRIPDVEKGEELVFQKDIRMVGFCPWGGSCENEK